MSSSSKPWRVLLLSAGFGNELLRGVTHNAISNLGFEVSVYDHPGYPVDTLVHSHASCVEAVEQHDIVIALLDEKEGGTFQIDQIPVGMRSRLIGAKVIQNNYATKPMPTILQVEVLTARAAGKPVICLIPESVREVCHTELARISTIIDRLKPRGEHVPDATDLVASKQWEELHYAYEVPTAVIPFGQLAFLEHIRHESPNFISYYNLGNPESLQSHIASRLADLPVAIARYSLVRSENRLLRTRAPIAGSESIAWLRDHGLIVSGPYNLDSISGGERAPLLSEGRSVMLPDYLQQGISVALLGDPGMGKSTYLLLAMIDLMQDSSEPGPNVLFASWRELPQASQRSTADHLIRTLIGVCMGRSGWPPALPLPSIHWHIILDGIDESDVDLMSLRPLIRDLRDVGTLLISCREYEFDRYLYSLQESFEEIVRLVPWGRQEIDQYRDMLAAQGDYATVQYIDSHRDDYRGVFSVPLWLTMITFLNRRSALPAVDGQINDYVLLSQCASAVAEDELRRNADDDLKHTEVLARAWRSAAWRIYLSRRKGDMLREEYLRELLDLSDERIWSACRSLLDERNGIISGFIHEIFLEYWLASYFVSVVMLSGNTLQELVDALSLQRSVTTNRLIRQGIFHSGRMREAAAGLREAFWQLDDRQNFAKNQILYLLGRVDDSTATTRFLTSVWNNEAESDFVRYSAAYAAVILGVTSIEESFYSELISSDTFDRMNRWYHRYYYGDLHADESAGPGLDDGSGTANQAILQLMRRLKRKQPRHLRLRRIELFTLRKFIETRGPEVLSTEMVETLKGIENEILEAGDRSGFARGVEAELARIKLLYSS